jgi:tRNA (guanine37-N1)-methyltransferase
MLRCFLGLFNAFGISMSLVDKSVFKSTLNLCALRIHAKDTSKTLTLLRDEALFSRPRMKRVVEVPEGDVGQRLVLLSERITTVEDLPRYEELQTEVQVLGITTYALHLGYEHMSVEEVLRRLLPVGVEVPSSFEQIGHIAHLNLRDEMLPYKSVIGQVIIDKTPTIKTVINKIGNIQNEFRTFPMEVLAGDPNFKVVIRESGAKFTFDFSRVYWNSRLQMVRVFLSLVCAHNTLFQRICW